MRIAIINLEIKSFKGYLIWVDWYQEKKKSQSQNPFDKKSVPAPL